MASPIGGHESQRGTSGCSKENRVEANNAKPDQGTDEYQEYVARRWWKKVLDVGNEEGNGQHTSRWQLLEYGNDRVNHLVICTFFSRIIKPPTRNWSNR